MKQTILKWLINTEERLKKLKKELKAEPKKAKPTINPIDEMLEVGRVDDGILIAEILHNKKEVIIRVRGFANEFRAFDWAKLQSVMWQSDQDAKDILNKDINKRLN